MNSRRLSPLVLSQEGNWDIPYLDPNPQYISLCNQLVGLQYMPNNNKGKQIAQTQNAQRRHSRYSDAKVYKGIVMVTAPFLSQKRDEVMPK